MRNFRVLMTVAVLVPSSQILGAETHDLEKSVAAARTKDLAAARSRLERDLQRVPQVMRRHVLGRWSVVNHSFKPSHKTLTARITVNYNPVSILKYYSSFRYILELELRNGVWQLISVRDHSYFLDRPPSLWGLDNRGWRSLSRDRDEFKWLQSCFR